MTSSTSCSLPHFFGLVATPLSSNQIYHSSRTTSDCAIAIFHDKNKGYVVMVQEDFLKTLHETLDEEDHDSKASDYADKALAILHAFNAIPYNAELAKELKKAQA